MPHGQHPLRRADQDATWRSPLQRVQVARVDGHSRRADDGVRLRIRVDLTWLGHYPGHNSAACTLANVSEPARSPVDQAGVDHGAVDDAEIALLRQRLVEATAQIETLRAESATRQAEIRALAAQLPERVSRRAVVTSMVGEPVRKIARKLRTAATSWRTQ